MGQWLMCYGSDPARPEDLTTVSLEHVQLGSVASAVSFQVHVEVHEDALGTIIGKAGASIKRLQVPTFLRAHVCDAGPHCTACKCVCMHAHMSLHCMQARANACAHVQAHMHSMWSRAPTHLACTRMASSVLTVQFCFAHSWSAGRRAGGSAGTRGHLRATNGSCSLHGCLDCVTDCFSWVTRAMQEEHKVVFDLHKDKDKKASSGTSKMIKGTLLGTPEGTAAAKKEIEATSVSIRAAACFRAMVPSSEGANTTIRRLI